MKNTWIIVLALILGNVGLYAQVTATGSLSGTVTDQTGAIVPNAVVQVSDARRLRRSRYRKLISHRNGAE